jgi:ABC-type nitrate/sulfonate/bicarbonate transport system permease component
MPAKDTMCISLGNWIIAFYVVYLITAIAVLSAVGLLTDRIVRIVRSRQLVWKDKLPQQISVSLEPPR